MKKVQKDLERWYRDKGLNTPTMRESMEQFSDYPESLVKEVFSLLLREGILAKVSESLYYDAAVIDALQEKMTVFIEKEGRLMPRALKISRG